VDVSALVGASGAGGGVDGRVESVQDGKASVRLLGGSTIQVPVDRELPTGTPVTVATASDGTLQLTVRTPDADLAKLRDALLNALQSLLGEPLASTLSAPLARGDFAAAARSLPSAASPSSVGSTASGPVFLSDPASPRPPSGTALVAILSTLGDNAYSAEVAGQTWTLLGPSGVEPATRLLAHAQILPGGGAVWTPDLPLEASPPRGLPERVQAGSAGAKELLQWAGVQDASPAEIEDLGKALAAAAKALFDQVQPEAGSAPVAADPAGTGSTPPRAPASEPSPPPAPVAEAPAPIGNPVGQTPPQAAVREVVAAPASAEGNPPAAPAAVEATPVHAQEAAAGNPAEVRAASGPAAPAPAPMGDPQPEAKTPSPAQIPSNIAVKVLAAWSLDLPATEAVRRASLGQAPLDLPAALDSLEKFVQASPGKHPGLEAALQGLERQVPSGNLDDGPRRTLDGAVLEALAKESAQGGDAKPLRQAAESLLADRLPDPAPGSESGQAYWVTGQAGREKARIVVRDERERKGGTPSQSRFHAVDVAMDPTGLGRIDARLELRGNVLTTRLRAADPDTADLLRKGLPELSAAFARIGLEPGALEVRSERPPGKVLPRRRGAGGALDVRA